MNQLNSLENSVNRNLIISIKEEAAGEEQAKDKDYLLNFR